MKALVISAAATTSSRLIGNYACKSGGNLYESNTCHDRLAVYMVEGLDIGKLPGRRPARASNTCAATVSESDVISRSRLLLLN